MMKPRCGNADIINGTNWMRGGKKRPNQAHNTFHTVSHYGFLPGSPKWLSNQLTYTFLPGTNSDAQSAVARAFDKWAAQTHFTFSRSQDLRSANLKIVFGRLDHGDGIQNAFDGPGGTVPHAFPPTNGRFHYDADESWSVGGTPLIWRLWLCMRLGTSLGLGIAQFGKLSCTRMLLLELPKVCMETTYRGLKLYTILLEE
ncbi:hypothetical protein RHGRI_022944 [Rhododendron griersonianum]|uniref:Peptidase metallopeptidase domain-containing protein n=1 Tax=Rhododendron griersonianum TaxID=479676 RepID=A0AAV6J674_9ERIC|nr:hypothetical protein RHGRI_022944 [Rhododendron griersonianum]